MAERAYVETSEHTHTLSQGAAKIELTPHRAVGDVRDLRLQPSIVSKLIEAFLPDDGRIHVGDEQLAPARLVALDE